MIELAADLLVAFLLVLTTMLVRAALSAASAGCGSSAATSRPSSPRSTPPRACRGGDRRHPRQRARSATRARWREGAGEQRIGELTRLVDSAGRMARRVETALHQGARSMAESARSDPAEQSLRRNRQLRCAPGGAAARGAARRAEDRRRAAARARGTAVSQAATRVDFPHCPGYYWSRRQPCCSPWRTGFPGSWQMISRRGWRHCHPPCPKGLELALVPARGYRARRRTRIGADRPSGRRRTRKLRRQLDGGQCGGARCAGCRAAPTPIGAGRTRAVHRAA